MIKVLGAALFSAAILAASSGFAAAADYPPCKSKSDDHCMQTSGGHMMPMSEPSKKMGSHKMMHHEGSMKKMGHETSMKKMAPAMKEMGHGSSMKSSGIPHGCSPATTPCQ